MHERRHVSLQALIAALAGALLLGAAWSPPACPWVHWYTVFQAQTSQRSFCSCWMLSYIAFLPSVTLAVYTFTACGAKGGCGASSCLCLTSTIPCPFAAWPAPAESSGPRGAQLSPFQGVGETSVLPLIPYCHFPSVTDRYFMYGHVHLWGLKAYFWAMLSVRDQLQKV